jgi:hypothetical protein
MWGMLCGSFARGRVCDGMKVAGAGMWGFARLYRPMGRDRGHCETSKMNADGSRLDRSNFRQVHLTIPIRVEPACRRISAADLAHRVVYGNLADGVEA